MLAAWARQLEKRLEEAPPGGAGLWQALAARTTPAETRPQLAPNLVVRELHDRRAPYLVLKNPNTRTYLRVSPEEYRLLQQLDGEKSLQDLIVDHYMQTGVFSRDTVFHLVGLLHQKNMLAIPPQAAWRQLREALEKDSWRTRLAAPARLVLTRRLSIRNLDRLLDSLYRRGGRFFFSRPLQVLYVLVSVLGFAAFALIVREGALAFIGDDLVRSLAGFWVAAAFTILVHEIGHALTVKHFGREVHQGGLLLFFGMPAAFVDTTDIWLEPRRARLAVTWNGPYTGLIVGGLASILIYAFPGARGNLLLFQLAGYAYATVFLNVNPLLKLDGYYLLADALDISALRERSIHFVTRRLFPGLFARKPFTREERIFAVYGVLTLVWTAYALYFAFFFWQTRISQSLQGLFHPGHTFWALARGALLGVFLASLAALLVFTLVRAARTLQKRLVRSGLLTRHTRWGLLLGGLAGLIGFGMPAWLPRAIPAFSAAMFLAAAAVVYRIAGWLRPYRGARKFPAYLFFLGAVGLAAASLFAGIWAIPWALYQAVVWITAACVLLGGIFLLLPHPGVRLRIRVPSRAFLLGVGIGVLGMMLLSRYAGLLPTDLRLWGIAALAGFGAWTAAAFRGGARAPAILLIFLGSLCLCLTLVLPQPFPYGFTGSLLLIAGGVHLISARLPTLTIDPQPGVSGAREATGAGAAVLVRRVMAQVFFESGWRGAAQLGGTFSEAMRAHGLALSITRNRFKDQELPQRTAGELAEVYRLAFDALYDFLCRSLGKTNGRLAFGYGLDLLPWQNREILAELILSRTTAGLALRKEVESTRAQILDTLRRVPLFGRLNRSELEEVAGLLAPARYAAGEAILRQGDWGDAFFILARGEVSVWVAGEDHAVDRIGAGQHFGEAALVSNQPRNATVIAETPVLVYTLQRETFDLLLTRHPDLGGSLDHRTGHSWLLRGMPIFDEMAGYELDWLALQLAPERYAAGEVVFNEGDVGEKFYIIEEGEVAVTREVNGSRVELSRRGPGEYLGEIALIRARLRSATVTALQPTTLLALGAEDFRELLAGYREFDEAVSRTSTRRKQFIDTAVRSERSPL